MAKQKGKIKAKGTVDENLNFYKTRMDGFLARILPGVSSNRFWEDPAFEAAGEALKGLEPVISSLL